MGTLKDSEGYIYIYICREIIRENIIISVKHW